MSELMEFKIENGAIQISIPINLIEFAATHNPQSPCIVHDKDTLANKVLFELEFNLGKEESGLTGLQQLIDEAIETVIENGEDCIDLKEN